MPSGAAARVVGLLDQRANLLERIDVFGVLAQGKFDLGLLQHGVNTAQPVGGIIGQRVEAAQCIVEIRQRFVVTPAALRFLGRQDRVID